ncbi:MAG: acyl-CoA thioesterase [Ilumatobacteraceae bacterium]
MFELTPHGPDTFVGTGPKYPWGGLYGGQIVAQALRAATLTAEEGFRPHSIRAYFIRPGDHTEPIRYEVDRIRNGRSFLTRRVVARQAIGAILNAECSFQRLSEAVDLQTVNMPMVPAPDTLEESSFTRRFDRCFVPENDVRDAPRTGAGRVTAWIKVNDDDLVNNASADAELMHQCWLAYTSDDLATDTVRAAAIDGTEVEREHWKGVSLDHTIWFHRPMRSDVWHLHDFTCHHFTASRGLAVGHVFTADGEHVATVAQEVLLRDIRAKPTT